MPREDVAGNKTAYILDEKILIPGYKTARMKSSLGTASRHGPSARGKSGLIKTPGISFRMSDKPLKMQKLVKEY
uniref:50S ribosomal protein L4 n=1 Tax=Romanomermis culicivorax TaxID=13658 RepID=A0A915ISD5_ROMCU